MMTATAGSVALSVTAFGVAFRLFVLLANSTIGNSTVFDFMDKALALIIDRVKNRIVALRQSSIGCWWALLCVYRGHMAGHFGHRNPFGNRMNAKSLPKSKFDRVLPEINSIKHFFCMKNSCGGCRLPLTRAHCCRVKKYRLGQVVKSKMREKLIGGRTWAMQCDCEWMNVELWNAAVSTCGIEF